MRSRWDSEQSMQTPAFPRVGLLSLPEEPLGEKSQGVATIALPFGVLLLLVDSIRRDVDDEGKTERTVLHAIKRVMQNARLNPEDVRSVSDLLRQSINAANADLYSNGSDGTGHKPLTASCALVLVARGRAYVAHVGNARAYLVRNNAANRLTRDHTTAQTWIDHGIMTEEQARERPEAHSLSRSLGEKKRLEPDVRSLPVRIEKGDILLLCSAGIHRYLDDDEMGSMVARLEPEHACQEMCEVAVGRSKNSACKAVVYQSGPQRQGNYPRLLQQRRLRRQRRTFGVIGAVVALLALVGLAWHFMPEKGIEPSKDVVTAVPDVTLLAATADVSASTAAIDLSSSPEVTVAPQPDVVTVESDIGSLAAPDVVADAGIIEGRDTVPEEDRLQPDIAADGDVAMQPVDVVSIEPGVVAPPPQKRPVNSIDPATAEPMWAPPMSEEAKARCKGGDLERGDRRRVRDLRYLVKRGMENLTGRKKNAAVAAGQAKAAAKTLSNSSEVVNERCADHVQDLLNHAKARYLHLSWVSATRAMNNLENRVYHCGKAYRMARDAQRLGATDEELKECRRICTTPLP